MASNRPRRNLSLDEIVSTATDILRDIDDGSLTMRQLATSCGVTPMALYNHIDDKESLLTLVVDRVLEPLVLFEPAHADIPRDALIAFGGLMRSLLLDHRGAATTFLRRPVLSPTMTLVTEVFFELVGALELDGVGVAETVDAIVLVTMGSIVNDLTRPPEIRLQLAANEAGPEAPLMVSQLDDYAGRDAEQRYRQAIGWIIDGACAP